MKEKSQERELLPNLRPTTEDFLTFLCFRGTNSLPKELDFQNNASTSGTSKATPDKKTKEPKTEAKKKLVAKKNETVTSTSAETAKKSSEKDPKTGFMPFAVRKRAEMHPAKNDKKKLSTTPNAKKKQDTKEESSSAPRATRANPVDEKPAESSNSSSAKKNAKRKSAAAEENHSSPVPKDVETSSEKKVPSTKKAIKNAKETARLEEEKRQTRLSAIRAPSTSAQKEPTRNGNESPVSQKYFSSSDDDDQPLVKSEPKNKKAKLQDTSMKSNVSNLENMAQDAPQQPVKSNRGRKKKVVPPVESEVTAEKITKVESEEPAEKKKPGRKKKTNVELDIANSQANTTDLSENEARGRPTRKTKEAATIYMELIGRKLTLQDSSDNDSSLDSLEAPNLKRVQLMENEFKGNNDKAKEAEAEKKKKEDKQVSRLEFYF